MSILRSKHSGWTHEGTRTPYMGGGGGGQAPPTTTYSQTSNIPDYAKPYVETMLGATQKQLFKMDDSGITGFEPYKAYSKDPNDYVAGFSPLQQQAQSGAANLQVPGQYGQASRMTGQAGMGSLGLAGQMAGTGQQYAMGATDPRTTQAYMSPYMQNVVDYQKSQALRDYQMSQPVMQARAVGQGAFGGNRLALQQSEAQRGLMSQLQGIEATGAQSAFQNAQQAQQFGANLGLQGRQGALQGLGQYGQMAGQLGQLGTAQLGAQQGIIGTQAAQGAAQQAQEQSKINQAIQDYAIQQQYPLMQLGFMSNMLRGLPMQAQTTQLYQAQPSTMQQGIGLLGAGASLMGAQGRAGGGEIKEMAEGGIAGYKYGGAIPEAKLAGMAENLSIEQLKQRLQDPQLDGGERQIFADALQDKARIKARSEGIAAAGGGLFDTMGYAGGGILAFADEGAVKDPEELANQINLIGAQLDTVNKEAASKNAPGSRQKAYRKDSVAEYENLQKRQGELKNEYADLMSKAGLDKPAFNYQPSRSLGGGTPANPVEQSLLGNKPATTPAMPTEGEFKAFDEATQRYLAEQKAKAPGAAGSTNTGATGSQAYGAPTTSTKTDSSLGGILAGLKKEGPKGELGADALKTIEENLGGAGNRMSKAEKLAMARGFIKFGTEASPGGLGTAALKGFGEYAEGYGKALESDEKYKAELAKQKSDILNLRRAEERGDVKLASEIRDKIEDRANRLQTANISASAANSARAQDAGYVKQLMAQGMTLEQALQAVKGAGKAESNDITRVKTALAELNGQLTFLKKDDPRRAKIEEQIGALTQMLTNGIGTQVASNGVPKDIQGILSKYQ
jgi:hypothetical protein